MHSPVRPLELVHHPLLLRRRAGEEPCHAELHIPLRDGVVLQHRLREPLIAFLLCRLVHCLERVALRDELCEGLEVGVSEGGEGVVHVAFEAVHLEHRAVEALGEREQQRRTGWRRAPGGHP